MKLFGHESEKEIMNLVKVSGKSHEFRQLDQGLHKKLQFSIISSFTT